MFWQAKNVVAAGGLGVRVRLAVPGAVATAIVSVEGMFINKDS